MEVGTSSVIHKIGSIGNAKSADDGQTLCRQSYGKPLTTLQEN